jgi:phosphoserine phosphatase
MKAGDSLEAGNYKLVYTGVSGNSAVFNINDLKGKTLDTMEVPAGKTRAVAPHNECSGYVLSVTSVYGDGTADAEVKAFC